LSRADVYPSARRCRAFVRSTHGWRETSSFFVPANSAKARSFTVVAANRAACTATSPVPPARGKSASARPAGNTGNLPTAAISTATKRLSGVSVVASSAWGIAAALLGKVSYRRPPQQQRVKARSRSEAMDQVRQRGKESSGCWLPGRGYGPARNACWASRWRAPAVAGGERWSKLSMSADGAGEASGEGTGSGR